MPESLFQPNDIDVRRLTIESPGPEPKAKNFFDTLLNEQQWQEILEYFEDDVSGMGLAGMKLLAPDRYEQLSEVKLALMRNMLTVGIEPHNFAPETDSEFVRETNLHSCLDNYISLAILFPEIARGAETTKLSERQAARLKTALGLLIQYRTVRFQSELLGKMLCYSWLKKEPDLTSTEWTAINEYISADTRQDIEHFAVFPHDRIVAWPVAAAKLYSPGRSPQVLDQFPGYIQRLESTIRNCIELQEWNALFEWALLTKIITAHDVQYGPDGLVIHDAPPKTLEPTGTPLPEQRRY